MRSFLFRLGAPGPGEAAIASINLYESADGMAAWSLADTILVVALADDVASGKKLWVSALADPTQYAHLVPASSAGMERPGAAILPPAPQGQNTFTLFCWLVDLGLAATKGVGMQAGPAVPGVKAGAALVIRDAQKFSNAQGFVSMSLPSDVGVVNVTISGHVAAIDTTGRSGSAINFADHI